MTAPSRTTAVPQMPMRWPPCTVKKPLRTRSRAAWAEAWVAVSNTAYSSRWVTGSPDRGRSPSGNTTVMGRPVRRRSSSARPWLSLSSPPVICRSRGGSRAAAWRNRAVSRSSVILLTSFFCAWHIL